MPTTGAAGIRSALRRRAQATTPITTALRVDEIVPVSPGFLRVSGTVGAELDGYRALPADAFKLAFEPDDAGSPRYRAFTVRHFDPETRGLVFDIARHDGGLALDWLAGDPVGEQRTLHGMRPDWAAVPGATHHLLIGDATALPAIAAVLEHLPATSVIDVVVALAHPADTDLLPDHPGAEITVVESISAAVDLVPRTVATGGHPQTWVAAEASQVRRVRAHALSQWHIDRDDLLARAYWKQGQSATESDDRAMGTYRAAAAQGRDLADPDLVEEIELA